MSETKLTEIEDHPVNDVQWVPRNKLSSNSYNPNYVAKPELMLLKRSILEDGWTMPIVVTPDFEIVDGFHRWTVSGDPEIFALTGGLVPVSILTGKDEHDLQASTIRHNRARGNHMILRMANVVRSMVHDGGLDEDEVMQQLGMDREEFRRMMDTSTMRDFGSDEFERGFVPH